MKEYKKLRIEVIGYEDQLQKLAHFLKLAEYLGNIGSTRTLKLWIDGDGATRLKINFPDMEDQPKIDDKRALSIGGKTEEDFLTVGID